MVERRIFVSATSDTSLDERRKSIKAGILDALRAEKLAPQLFFEAGLAENLPWSFDNVDSVMRRCTGAVILGFPRWTISAADNEIRFVGEYNHYEGAVAMSHKLPVLLLAERGVQNRGVVWTGGGRTITFIPENADATWVQSAEFKRRFNLWRDELALRRDVFLGYCSQNVGVAAQIENRMTRAGVTVLNYQMDFRQGVSILSEIEAARARCSCGVFIFGENDPMQGKTGEAAPRDNVVFEAGYFMSSKGADRCLIIREENAKMPADLGGAIYLSLQDGNVNAIETQLIRFLKDSL